MLIQLLTLWGVLAALYALPATGFSSLTLLISGVLLSLPVAVYLHAYPLFLRRTVLAGVTAPESLLRRWLWHGSLVSIAALITGCISGIVLLSLSPGYGLHHWLTLAGAALVLAAFDSPSRRWLTGQASADFLPVLQRRLLARVTLGLALLAVTTWEFQWMEHADLRQYSAVEVTTTYFETASQRFVSPLAGMMAGVSAALDALAMHSGQTYAPEITNLVLRLGLWLALLAKAALQLSPAILLLSGVSALLDLRRQRGWRVLGHSLFARIFMLTLCLLGSLVLFAYHQLANSPPPAVADRLARCEPAAVDLQALDAQRQAQTMQLQHSTLGVIDQQLDQVFAQVEIGVDQFLDWQYSLRGEYTMLLWAATGRFHDKLAERVGEIFGDTLDTALSTANAAVANHIDGAIRQLPQLQASAQAGRSLNTDCALPIADPVQFPMHTTVVAKIPATALAGVGGALIVKKVAPKMAGKVLANLVVKFSGAGGALALSSLCGPAMPVCAAGLAAGFWVVTDLGMIAMDEALTRDAMRAELLSLMAAQRAEIQTLFENYYEGEIARSVGRTFNIPRDGV